MEDDFEKMQEEFKRLTGWAEELFKEIDKQIRKMNKIRAELIEILERARKLVAQQRKRTPAKGVD
jgi:ElaB/YqjD/DUF883 family membrane-anchored ribosome-binding protein